jgi:hypothetical protein
MRISKQLALLTIVFAALITASTATAALPTQFGTQGSGAGQFVEATGVAVNQSNGDVYVSDKANNRVEEFTAEGAFVRAFGWGVSDGTTEAFQVCNAPGPCFAGLSGTGAGQLDAPEGIAVDNSGGLTEGDVYVEDSANLRIERFTESGEFVSSFGEAGSGPAQFEALERNAIAVGSLGTVYVGDRGRVQEFDSSGVPAGGFALPEAEDGRTLAVDSAGDVYVLGAAGGIYKFNGAGVEQPPVRDPEASGRRPAIAVGPGDELFVSDPGSEHIFVYDANGKQLSSIVEQGAGDAEGGIAFGNTSEALYVLHSVPARVMLQTLLPPGPAVNSQSAETIQPTSATLGAVVNPEGPEATSTPASVHFEYGTSATYGESTTPQELTGGGFEDQSASAVLSGLQPRTIYHFRVVVENAAKEVTSGPDQTFETLPPVSIDSTSVSKVSATAATLETELNPHDVASTYRFEYDTTPYAEGEAAHGASTPDMSAGAATIDLPGSAQVQGLTASTTYYYRVVAENTATKQEGRPVDGPDRSFITQGAVASVLPDGRQWEMVSPPNKQGIPLESITAEGGLIQAAADGSGLAYIANGPIDTEPAGSRSGVPSQLLAKRRAPGVWSTQDLATPHQAPVGVFPGHRSEYYQFSPDLSAGLVEPFGATPLAPEDPANTERTPYRREADGRYVPLVSTANVPPGTKFGGEEERPESFNGSVQFVTGTPDLSHVLLRSPAKLVEGFENSGVESIYEWSGGKLEPVSVQPNGTPFAETTIVGYRDLGVRNAISADGARVFFNAGAEGLYMRDMARGETVRLNAPAPGVGESRGGAVFQMASSDGEKVFFIDEARLTKDATARGAKPDLYECTITLVAGKLACELKDLSVDQNNGEPANVKGATLGTDEGGRYVYFVANGALAAGAVQGNCEGVTLSVVVAQSCNLYVRDTETDATRLVAVLSGADFPDWRAESGSNSAGEGAKNLGEVTSRVSPNGRYLAFMSQRPLAGYDNRDARSGVRDEEVYLYDYATNKLICASCNPSGQRPTGIFDSGQFPGPLVDRQQSGNWSGQTLAANIPGWTKVDIEHATYQSRYLSNSGRLFFNAADALVPQDSNGVMDVYEYEPPQVEGQSASNSCTTTSSTYGSTSGGCVSLISSGTSAEESAFLDASETGDDVFFLTASKLAPQDVDSALDVYDAHVCSAESPCAPPPPPPPPACSGDACQNPVAAPNDATPGSLTFHGPGNLTPPAAVKPKAKPLTRAQKLTKALKVCKSKQNKRKRQACEKAARKNYSPLEKAKKKKKRKGK